MNLPRHLSERFATHAQEFQLVAQFEVGSYKNFVYLILDWNLKKAAIVDPQHDLSGPMGCIKKHGFELTTVLLTHSHFDHIAGVPQIIKDFSDISVRVHRDDLHRLDSRILDQAKIVCIEDGDQFQVGNFTVQVIHTPGHSSGECCFFIAGSPPYLFTGDTVFIRDCGRTDLDSGSNEQMFHSLQRIKKLPINTVLLPGHHYQPECASTLASELKTSPPFQCKSVEELAALP